MPSFMYGAAFVNFLLLVITIVWVVFKSPDSLLSIIAFLVLLHATLAFLFSYPIYFFLIRKKHYHGLETKVFRSSLKWGGFAAFLICGLLGLRAFDLWTVLNMGLFLALCFALVLGMFNNKV